MTTEMIEKLKMARKNPRLMSQQSLIKNNVWDFIHDSVPNHFKVKHKIDIILSGNIKKCEICNVNIALPERKWCSKKCKDQHPDVKAKISKINKENSSDRVQKMKNTLMLQYGVSAIQDIPEVKLKTKEKKQKYYEYLRSLTFPRYGLDKEIFCDKDYLKQICKNSSYSELSERYFNNMPPMTILRHFRDIDFDPGFNKTQSRGEREVVEFVKSLGLEVKCNDRKEISPLELDILIPTQNVAIEYNGIWTHSRYDKHYHINKTQLCKNKGIQLIHIFEDEWELNKEIVKSLIKSKLGIYDFKYFARKLTFSQVSKNDARQFLDNNHLQGSINGIHYGLYDNDNLISMITVGRCRFGDKNKFELYRFATLKNTQVVGGFSKLLSNYKSINNVSIITYADLRYSNGNVYESTGGKLLRQTEPNYWWTNRSSSRIPRYKTQKHKLIKLLGDKFDPSLSESDNMINAGYLQLFDCGNLVFEI